MNGDCVVGAKHGAEIEELHRMSAQNTKEHDDMWKAINYLRYRLPLWATLSFGVLASCVTGLLVAIVK